MFRLIQLIQVIFIGYNRDISLTPFDPFPVSPLWFSMLLLSLLFLCACNSWWVHVYVWFRVKSGLLIDCLIPSRLGFPLTYSTFPCLHLHLLDRWGGGKGVLLSPPDVLFSIILLSHSDWFSGWRLTSPLSTLLDILSSLYDDVPVPVLIKAVGSPCTAVEFGMRFGTFESHLFTILQSVRDHWETHIHY